MIDMPDITEDYLSSYDIATILLNGPTRLLLNAEGHAVHPRHAAVQYGQTTMHTVFIRDDGWSIGAPLHLATIAYQLYVGNWLGFIDMSTGLYSDISEYSPEL